jgi:predicted AlkP superfamily phosphohydrolase/phosphomutase
MKFNFTNRYSIVAISAALLLSTNICAQENQKIANSIDNPSKKLSWFIPDGFRADPDLFDIFRWAEEGKLPNIKRMMDKGSYGYSIPVFPSHTPANFAALLTGMYPMSNGVPDGPMRIEGKTLQSPAVGGFSSSARKVPAVWGQFEKDKSVVLLSMPGSTPPELKNNAITIRGRWGGWGADMHSIVFEKLAIEQRTKLGRNSRLFMQGMELTQYINPNPSLNLPENNIKTKSNYLRMEVSGTPIYARLNNSNGGDKPFTISFSRDKVNYDTTLKVGEWSKWYPIEIDWKGRKVSTNIKFHVIKTGANNFFRIRVLVDSMNEFIVEPGEASATIEKDIGPMVDFPDNFPSQLVYYKEDKKTFVSEAKASIDWHKKAVDSIYKNYQPDVFIHDIYTPNQMLTSKWWMGYIDPQSTRYNDVSEKERNILWNEVKEMYLGIDAILGKTLDHADKDTLVVFSSDHGAIPLNVSVQINNLFAKKGWITYGINPKTGESIIDWEKSKVVFLKMSNIYINPFGLGPTYKRVSGPEYENLRAEVIETLKSLKDSNGISPLEAAVKWEDHEKLLKLPPDRSGDLVVANKPGYGWAEDLTEDGRIFVTPEETGYKQAIFAENVKGLWAPFIVVGNGIKKNHKIETPIHHVDQLPTILRAMNIQPSDKVEGKAVNEIFK